MITATAIMCFVFGWHASGAWHQRIWSRDITRRAERLATGDYRHPAPLELIHGDQDCAPSLPAPPSIKAICLDAHFGRRHRG